MDLGSGGYLNHFKYDFCLFWWVANIFLKYKVNVQVEMIKSDLSHSLSFS